MSVPLDRLYNFLHDVCNRDDIIIYRFYPHGSRKIEDLSSLNKFKDDDVIKNPKTIFIFCNDQEPLNFDLYQNFDVSIAVKKMNLDFDQELLEKSKIICQKIMSDMNLKWAVGLNLWKHNVLLFHSEQRSTNLLKYEQLQFVGVYWWSHALIARDWFRYAEHDVVLTKKNLTKDFLIYNRAWTGTREYRIKFTDMLVNSNLLKNCLTWFNEYDSQQHYLQHNYQNSNFAVVNTDLAKYFIPSTVDGNASADYNGEDYQKTAIEVVLETLFDDERLHLTEKTLRPIACGHPFILAATHGSLEYLKKYGFETFSPYIDESYDLIKDPVKRLEAIIKEMKKIANLNKDKKLSMYSEIFAIADRNKKLFFSNAWQQNIINEFKTNFETSIKEKFS